MENVYDVPKNFVGPENFLDPLNGTLSEIFLATGGGGRGGEVVEINLFHKNIFGTGRAQSEKVGQISFCPPNFFVPVRPCC